MTTRECDILVVGGGPAGATAARHLALAGRDVLLIDKAHMPRHKPCGGGVPGHTLTTLELDISPVVDASVQEVVLDGGWTGRQRYRINAPCVVVERAKFDHFLFEAARSAGAEIEEGVALKSAVRNEDGTFTATTAESEIHAALIVAADGAYSPTAKALGFGAHEAQGVALEALVRFDDRHDEAARRTAIFEFATVKRGYCWVFPRGDVMNVGVGTGRPGEGKTLRDRLTAFMQRMPELRGREVFNIKGGQLPDFCSPRHTFADRGVYLVGDAAGFIDPLTGEGIHFAVLSGRRAAEAIVSGGGEAGYTAALAAEVVPELCYAARYARRYRKVPSAAFRLAMCLPRFKRYAQHFVNILSGTGSYDQMWRALHPRRKTPPV